MDGRVFEWFGVVFEGPAVVTLEMEGVGLEELGVFLEGTGVVLDEPGLVLEGTVVVLEGTMVVLGESSFVGSDVVFETSVLLRVEVELEGQGDVLESPGVDFKCRDPVFFEIDETVGPGVNFDGSGVYRSRVVW